MMMGDSEIMWVECSRCGGQTELKDDFNEAYAAWNTRHERECEMVHECEVYEGIKLYKAFCSNCGSILGADGNGGTSWNYCPSCGARVKR